MLTTDFHGRASLTLASSKTEPILIILPAALNTEETEKRRHGVLNISPCLPPSETSVLAKAILHRGLRLDFREGDLHNAEAAEAVRALASAAAVGQQQRVVLREEHRRVAVAA